MSYTYLREQGAESSAASFSDIPAFVLSKLNLTVEKSCSNGNEMESCQSSRSGMMSEPLTENHGEEQLTLFAEDFPVKTLAPQVEAQESKETNRDCGPKWPGSLAKFNRDSYLWKTRQCSLFGGLEEFSEIWPRWGLVHDGELSELTTPAHITNENGSGLFPTPMASEAGKSEHTLKMVTNGQCQMTLDRYIAMERKGLIPFRKLPTPTLADSKNVGMNGSHQFNLHKAVALLEMNNGKLNPQWVEWLMGWPIEWTALQPLAMDKFQQWLSSHGKL